MRDVSLLDLADWSGEYDAERAEERKAALGRTARSDGESVEELSETRS